MAENIASPRDTAPKYDGSRRGLQIRNTALLIQDETQMDTLVQTAIAVGLTDVYLFVRPTWYSQHTTALAALNARLNALGLHIWAFYGDIGYLTSLDNLDDFISELTGLGDFNDTVESNARFSGFQVEIELEDTPDRPTGLNAGVAESKLSPEQYTLRGILSHQWLNLLTRTANLVHSYDMLFGAAIPFWLWDEEGESVTIDWAQGKTNVADLVMPLLDECAVVSQAQDSEIALARTVEPLQYASRRLLEAKKVPRVLVGVKFAEANGKQRLDRVATQDPPESHLARSINILSEKLSDYPAFAGVIVDEWDPVAGEPP